MIETGYREGLFEPHGDGFLFFDNIAAPGVPVSAEERAAFIADRTSSAQARLRRRIAGRSPTAPPRGGPDAAPFGDALPKHYNTIALIAAALMGFAALTTENTWAAAGIGLVAAAAVLSVVVRYVRRARRRQAL